MKQATFDRPTPATLVVRCDNGDEWEATDADLVKFGFIDQLTWARGENKLDGLLGYDLRERSELCSLVLGVIPWLAGLYDDADTTGAEHPEIVADIDKIRTLLDPDAAADGADGGADDRQAAGT